MKINARSVVTLAAFAAITAAACSSSEAAPTTQPAATYNQTCAVDSDCVAVVEGGCCSCPNATINRSDQAKYAADRAPFQAHCDDSKACAAGGACAPATQVGCVAGVCTFAACGTSCSDAGADAADASKE